MAQEDITRTTSSPPITMAALNALVMGQGYYIPSPPLTAPVSETVSWDIEVPDVQATPQPTTSLPTYTCAHCGKSVSSPRYYYYDKVYCSRECVNAVLFECQVCHSMYPTLHAHRRAGLKVCTECYDQLIWPYMAKPAPVFYGKATNKLYFGIEVELELEDYDFLHSLNRDYMYFKYDSSIERGCEVVSHPASYDELAKGQCKQAWEKLFQTGSEDISSDTNTTCGMHVHMSLDAFTSLHLYKFMKFIYENVDFTLFISRRTKRQLKRWAGVDNPDDASIVYKALTKRGFERHVAVALTPWTVEVRIFRGVLEFNQFMLNLQFCESLFQFTNMSSIGEVSVVNYIKYLHKNRKKYDLLTSYISSNGYKLNK